MWRRIAGMATRSELARYRENLRHEVDSAAIYRTLAAVEREPNLAEVYRRMAAAEAGHARLWEEKLKAAGQPLPPRKPSLRARTLAWLARRFGSDLVLPVLMDAEAGDAAGYRAQPEARGTGMARQERSHRRLLATIQGGLCGGLAGAQVARLEGRHRAVGGNALRAAVLGANDGLVSNLSLVMGVAGAALDNQALLITGFAGLLAGAISMALGEWLSVQSSRELYARQIAIEAEELAAAPEDEAMELALIYQAKGVPEQQARELAARLIANEDKALDTLAREELGIDPKELGGSAWEAALTSFALFAVGAIVPVLPFVLVTGRAAVAVSLGASAVGLFGIGATITLLTGRGVLVSGVRPMLFGLAAAAVTYAIGWLLGVSIAG
jgi:VIT1/CCC1 family predicted Fe2+/Mn2+ transporter